MKLPFTKMHGLGNDFVVFDFTQRGYRLKAEQAAQIADRHFGIGCDQILIVELSDREDIDFRYRILNADGSEVGQCGNGARCFAKFVHDKGLSKKSSLRVETLGGDLTLTIDDASSLVTVNMGVPDFSPSAIPLSVESQLEEYSLDLTFDQTPQTVCFSALSIGNPHAVLIVNDVTLAPVVELGKQLEDHAMFPQKANIGFMQILDKYSFALRVFERGVGETIACGSGACAAAIVGLKRGLLTGRSDQENTRCVQASLRGGDLSIFWQGEGQPVMMAGPAQSVFSGEIEL